MSAGRISVCDDIVRSIHTVSEVWGRSAQDCPLAGGVPVENGNLPRRIEIRSAMGTRRATTGEEWREVIAVAATSLVYPYTSADPL